MKVYIAGGMTVMNVIGRERELSQKFDPWRRLFSYHYKILIIKSEILNIVRDANKQNELTTSTGDS